MHSFNQLVLIVGTRSVAQRIITKIFFEEKYIFVYHVHSKLFQPSIFCSPGRCAGDYHLPLGHSRSGETCFFSADDSPSLCFFIIAFGKLDGAAPPLVEGSSCHCICCLIAGGHSLCDLFVGITACFVILGMAAIKNPTFVGIYQPGGLGSGQIPHSTAKTAKLYSQCHGCSPEFQYNNS